MLQLGMLEKKQAPDVRQNEQPKNAEKEEKPKKLYRAFTMDPRKLSVDRLQMPLVPGTVSEDDPTKILDGNELGVYMSTNKTMVESAYAHTPVEGMTVPAPRFKERGATVTWGVRLPQCGIVVEVDTDELDIRKPEITEVLQGVYNNGFEGDEFIADEVPPENYRVISLVLSRWANDKEAIVVDVGNEGGLEEAVSRIQEEFRKKEEKAREFATFLEGLTQPQRMNEILLKRAWQKHQKANS